MTFHVGAKYFLIVIDNLSRKMFFNIMNNFGVFDKLKVFKALVKNQIGKKFKTIKYDGGENIT